MTRCPMRWASAGGYLARPAGRCGKEAGHPNGCGPGPYTGKRDPANVGASKRPSPEQAAFLYAAAVEPIAYVKGGFWFPLSVARQAPAYPEHYVPADAPPAERAAYEAARRFYDEHHSFRKGTVTALLKRGWVEPVPGVLLPSLHPGAVRITPAGREALQAAHDAAAAAAALATERAP